MSHERTSLSEQATITERSFGRIRNTALGVSTVPAGLTSVAALSERPAFVIAFSVLSTGFLGIAAKAEQWRRKIQRRKAQQDIEERRINEGYLINKNLLVLHKTL